MAQLPLYGYVVGFAQQFLLHATVGMPEQAMWVTIAVIFILGAASTVDAFTEVVPGPVIFLGLFAVTAAQGLYVSWPFAAIHLIMAMAGGLLAWLLNEICGQLAGEKIFHAGDAKWTLLAVSCFDAMPVLYAWGFALTMGILQTVVLRMRARPVSSVYLAPYLFPGLLGALYILRVSLHTAESIGNGLKSLFS